MEIKLGGDERLKTRWKALNSNSERQQTHHLSECVCTCEKKLLVNGQNWGLGPIACLKLLNGERTVSHAFSSFLMLSSRCFSILYITFLLLFFSEKEKKNTARKKENYGT